MSERKDEGQDREVQDREAQEKAPRREGAKPSGVTQQGQGSSGAALGREHTTGTEDSRPGMQQQDEERPGR